MTASHLLISEIHWPLTLYVCNRTLQSFSITCFVFIICFFYLPGKRVINFILPRTAVMISRDNFPNSLLRAKSMCAFLYFLFCHSLCPFHLSCVLDKLKVVFGGRHCQTNADRPLTKQGFLVTVAAILDSRNFHISGERDEWNKFTVHMNTKAAWFLHTVAWIIIIFIIYLSLSETTGPNIGIKKN